MKLCGTWSTMGDRKPDEAANEYGTSHSSGTILPLQSLLSPPAISQSSGRALRLQSALVPVSRSRSSGTSLSLQSGSHSSGMPFTFRSTLVPSARSQSSGMSFSLQSKLHGATCRNCQLRDGCVTAGNGKGRTVTLHPQEALLQQARAFQQSEAFGEYKKRRHVSEHRLGRLAQLGIRQARYFGRAKTVFQLLMVATVANLTLPKYSRSKAGIMGTGPPHPRPTRTRDGTSIQVPAAGIEPKESKPKLVIIKPRDATRLLSNLSPSHPKLRRPKILVTGMTLATRLENDLVNPMLFR